ncbi:uncharacterized protein LOC128554258 [Mercenaria mercenaria]|uniref:uncharacterized protein LOC128554258 n=1 Tax=Mercenaria mercenaria TaxID=6596 RepID=UPI00234FA721|nr:uncharacterized protein LOC128554258 [Mercenaria mercenaria]XP_053391484.1 uncharacterized protein LOC128554258 [Mercenaria mercenaria]XP_053391485.1 uncharacterized protein LOC128554258 [Mercenaria mercenaria]
MEDGEFRFYRLVKCEKEVVQLSLQELFEFLWNLKYPETPWAKNAASVKVFEEKEEEHFQNSLHGLSPKENWSKIQKRNRLHSTFRDNEWGSYDWDISKFAYALVDSKLFFELEITDETGMPLSAHIVRIKYDRNEIAHFRKANCDTVYFEKILKSTEDYMKALVEVVKLNVSPYIEKLQAIKTEEKPVSAEVYNHMSLEFEKLKCSQLVYEEREKRYLVQEELSATIRELERIKTASENAFLKESHSTECERLKQTHSTEFKRLKQTHSTEFKRLKQTHSTEFKRLKQTHSTEFERLKQTLKQTHSTECERLKQTLKQTHSTEFERLKQTLKQTHSTECERLKQTLKQTHSIECERLKQTLQQTHSTECERMKQSHSTECERLKHALQSSSMEVGRLQSENALLKQRMHKLESGITLRKRKHSENPEEFQELKSEELDLYNKVKKSTEQTNFDSLRCKRNGMMKAVIVIIMVWHQVKRK